MEPSKLRFRGKYVVIVGYVLVVVIMIMGLFAVYRNLVDFSEKRVQGEDLSELIIVGNIINQLYEVEGTQNLFTTEGADEYFGKYNSIRPDITSKIDSLKQLSKDTLRIAKLDSIELLIDEKEKTLLAIAVLLDSINKAPQIIRQTTSTYVPHNLNSQIQKYLEDKGVADNFMEESDTTIIKGEQRGIIRRIGDAIRGRQDSTIIIQNRPGNATVHREEIKQTIDTVVNMVRYYERINLENQRKFQTQLLQRQSSMSHTNLMLTSRIDDLLKSIEKEEIDKSIKLIEEKDATLSRSSKIVFGVSLLAILLALIFGLLFFMDFSRSQRYRRRLEESYLRINQLLKSREKLMLSISHDIKAPMSSILGYLELMESGADENSRRMYLANMKKSSDHVLQLVTNLLDYQKIESGTWSRKEMNFNVYDLLENTANSFKPLADKKRLEYHVFNKVQSHLLAFGDPFMIREVYTNLISNAIKYTPQGKVEVFAETVAESDKTVLRFSVKDTGLGISEDNQEYIFQEFTQLKPEKIENHVEGSGLGLAITKGLVNELGGQIYMESQKGRGSEFFVDIPLEESRSIEVFTDRKEEQIDVDIENISILVVDDDPIQLTMMEEMLKLKKIKVVTEVNPEKVLNVLKNNVFDLIFLDIQMPRMNGFTLLRNIFDSGLLQSKSTPIVALSAKSDLSSKDLKQSGFSDFLNKPFHSRQLFELINKQLKLKLDAEKISHNNVSGVDALISFVKDDPESSLEILNAFVHDTEKNNLDLKNSLEKNNPDEISRVAHKMLPLFKMMGDEKLSDTLLKLDHRESVSDEDKKQAIEKIAYHVKDARKLIHDLEKNN